MLMDNSTVGPKKVQPIVRRLKKKQVKDEPDRQKQAEKKKRRLEKALATSAAIISELEKKKQKKKEEQQRLDEEGAAIAEAVALHVLLDEDSDHPNSKIVLNKNDCFNPWDLPGGRCSFESIGLVSNAYRVQCQPSSLGNDDWTFSSGPFGDDIPASYFEEAGWEAFGISAGLIASQAVSSLQIAEDLHQDRVTLNRMLRG